MAAVGILINIASHERTVARRGAARRRTTCHGGEPPSRYRPGGRGWHRRPPPAGPGHRRGAGRRGPRPGQPSSSWGPSAARTGPPWTGRGFPFTLLPGRGIVRSLAPRRPGRQPRRRRRAGRGRGAGRSRWWSGPGPGWWCRWAATPAWPASLAAVVLGVPLVLVNVDAVPGAANRLFGRFARASAVGWEGNPLPRAVVTGTPVRPEIAAVRAARPAARRRGPGRLGLPAGPTHGGRVRRLPRGPPDQPGRRRPGRPVGGAGTTASIYHIVGRRDWDERRRRTVGAGTDGRARRAGPGPGALRGPDGPGLRRRRRGGVPGRGHDRGRAGRGRRAVDPGAPARGARATTRRPTPGCSSGPGRPCSCRTPVRRGRAGQRARRAAGRSRPPRGHGPAAGRWAGPTPPPPGPRLVEANAAPARPGGRGGMSDVGAGPSPSGDPTARPRVHVVGIGGAGMSAIATVLHAMGHAVTGSDLQGVGGDRPPAAGRDRRGHRARRRPTWARPTWSPCPRPSPDDNPEVVEARRRGIAVLARAEALAAIASLRRCMAVAGTHGKTTTASMLALHAGGGRAAPLVPDRGRRQRDRHQRRLGRGRVAGGGGRRERRDLPRPGARRGRGDQRRGRPPRPLRDPSPPCGRPSSSSWPAPGVSRVVGGDDAGGRRDRPGGRGRHRRDWRRTAPSGSSTSSWPAARSPSSWSARTGAELGRPGRARPRAPQRPERRRGRRGRPGRRGRLRRRRPGPWPASPGWPAGSSSGARSTG